MMRKYTYSTLRHISFEKSIVVLAPFIINPLDILAYSSFIRRKFHTFALCCKN